jgi:hypothetical protein
VAWFLLEDELQPAVNVSAMPRSGKDRIGRILESAILAYLVRATLGVEKTCTRSASALHHDPKQN